MDLDQFKDVWKEQDAPVSAVQGKEQILAMLKKRSQGPIAKMKRNLRGEMVIVVVSYTAMIIHYFVTFDRQFQSVSWFLLLIGLFYILYYSLKNNLLNNMLHVSGKVKSHLQQQVTTLEKFVKLYLVAGPVLVLVCLAFFGWIFYTQVPGYSESNILFESSTNPLWKAVTAWTVLAVVLTIAVYYANVWLLNKLYGTHIAKLKGILKEMSEE